MARLTYTVVDDKALWNGRTLAEWLPDAVGQITSEFTPRRIILFGSVARGDDGRDSDIDLLVVFDEIDGRKRDLAVALQRSLADVGAPVDVLVTDLGEIDRRGRVPGVLRMALSQGKVVHERAA